VFAWNLNKRIPLKMKVGMKTTADTSFLAFVLFIGFIEQSKTKIGSRSRTRLFKLTIEESKSGDLQYPLVCVQILL
jgi:hypothetical protein